MRVRRQIFSSLFACSPSLFGHALAGQRSARLGSIDHPPALLWER